LLKKGFTPINLKAHFFGVKKWLTTNRTNGVDWAYITKPKVSTMIRDRIPTKEELSRILSNKIATRDRSFFLTASSSGLRIGTLAMLKVKDYKHVEELGMIMVEGGPNRKLPVGKSYFTFLTPEARKTLDDYLATRKNQTPESFLYVKGNGEPLSNYVTNITRQWRRLIKRANLDKKIEGHAYFELHGHTLRKYFQTKCKNAGCRADYVDFWMGHHPSRQDQYLNDSYFRPSLEENVAEYRKAVGELQVFENIESETKSKELLTRVEQLEKENAELKTSLSSDTVIQELKKELETTKKNMEKFDKLLRSAKIKMMIQETLEEMEREKAKKPTLKHTTEHNTLYNNE
jgi:site-specific recombinase XerD